MTPAQQWWVGVPLIVLVTVAVWLGYVALFDDGIDRSIFVNSPGTVYGGGGYIPLPQLKDTPRTTAGCAAVLALRGAAVSDAIALLGEPDAHFGQQGSVLVWHSAISSESPVASTWPVAHVVSIIDQGKVTVIAVIGSFGTVQNCTPSGAIGTGP